jgi:hypothetical protein
VGPVLREQLEDMKDELRVAVDDYPTSLYEVLWPMPQTAPQRH